MAHGAACVLDAMPVLPVLARVNIMQSEGLEKGTTEMNVLPVMFVIM